MALPIIPFVAGAVVGGLGVYLFRNEKLRRVVGRTAGGMPGKVKKTVREESDTVAEGSDGPRGKNSSEADEAPASRRKTAKK